MDPRVCGGCASPRLRGPYCDEGDAVQPDVDVMEGTFPLKRALWMGCAVAGAGQRRAGGGGWHWHTSRWKDELRGRSTGRRRTYIPVLEPRLALQFGTHPMPERIL